MNKRQAKKKNKKFLDRVLSNLHYDFRGPMTSMLTYDPSLSSARQVLFPSKYKAQMQTSDIEVIYENIDDIPDTDPIVVSESYAKKLMEEYKDMSDDEIKENLNKSIPLSLFQKVIH